MQASQRVAVNTVAQYTRTIINMGLSLYTVRLVLIALGESDYGIYTLVAGMVAMLSFITNSLVATTQRFVSYYQGSNDKNKVRQILNNSLVLHIFLGILVVVALELISPLLFSGFLNIPSERVYAAKAVYQTVVVMLFITFVTSPYRALLISHENIVYISIIDVFDGIIKVILAFVLVSINYDKLIFYGLMMTFVQLFNFICLSQYCYLKYEECCLPNYKTVTLTEIRKMMFFASWSVYSTGCIVGRQQGVAVVLNKWLGAAVNAAYGIAFQISSYSSFLSSALVNAIAPQIIKAEGGGDRERALRLSTLTCKYMFFLLSAICIPCIFEIDSILQWWLKDVPNHAGLFCRMVFVTAMADSLTVGLAHINQAIGKIGSYSLVINTPKLISVPLVVVCLALGQDLFYVAIVYVIVELFSSLLRLPFIHKTAGLDIKSFTRDVFLPISFPTVLCMAFTFLFAEFIDVPYRFMLTFILSMIFYAVLIYSVGLSQTEKSFFSENIKLIINKLRT